MATSTNLRFTFTADGHHGDGPAEMSVTYVGRISRKTAEADARRRFEEWRSLPSLLSRRWASNQVVVS